MSAVLLRCFVKPALSHRYLEGELISSLNYKITRSSTLAVQAVPPEYPLPTVQGSTAPINPFLVLATM